MNEDEKLVSEVRELLKEDQTKEALNLLLTYVEVKSEEYKLLVCYSASYQRVRSCFNMSLIPFDTYHSELNKIVLGLLNLIEVAFTIYDNTFYSDYPGDFVSPSNYKENKLDDNLIEAFDTVAEELTPLMMLSI